MAISMLEIRRPLGRLIFNMGIAIPGKTVFLIETAPRLCSVTATILGVCFQFSLKLWQTQLILIDWLASMVMSAATATQHSAGCCSHIAQTQLWFFFGRVYLFLARKFHCWTSFEARFFYSSAKTKSGITSIIKICKCLDLVQAQIGIH